MVCEKRETWGLLQQKEALRDDILRRMSIPGRRVRGEAPWSGRIGKVKMWAVKAAVAGASRGEERSGYR